MELPVTYNSLSMPEKRLVREEYIERQNGLCYHCSSSLKEPALSPLKINKRLFPDNFFKYPIHLHHCHKTGMTIGAVHNVCNAILWQYHGE